MTTKLPNPTYTPENAVMVAMLNFFITPVGLEDQLLGKTVEKERKDLEELKQMLTKSNAEKSKELKTLQDDILRMLQEAEGDILENEDLINTRFLMVYAGGCSAGKTTGAEDVKVSDSLMALHH